MPKQKGLGSQDLKFVEAFGGSVTGSWARACNMSWAHFGGVGSDFDPTRSAWRPNQLGLSVSVLGLQVFQNTEKARGQHHLQVGLGRQD